MVNTGIPELEEKSDIQHLREALMTNLSDEDATEQFKDLIRKALKNKNTNVMFALHIIAH